MRPSALEIVAGDFALAGGHGRVAVSFVAGTFYPAAAFSIEFADGKPPHWTKGRRFRQEWT
jgi:hypothetical protein